LITSKEGQLITDSQDELVKGARAIAQ